MTIFLKWLNRLTSVILMVLLVSMAGLVVSAKFSGGTPRIMGHELLTVLSGSMEPTIDTGAIIAVKPVEDPAKLKVGDVVTFKSADDPNMLITHRIVGIQGTGKEVRYVTKGDNNDAPDPSPVPAANVVGRYAGIAIPYAGYVMSFMKTKVGIALFMIVPGVYLIVSQIVQLWKAITRMEQQKNAEESA